MLAIPADPIERLVHDAVRVTGAALPALLTDASPALSISTDAPPPFYLIGLIGGKDVGKSSLAGAIAGVALGTPSNTGEGTRDAIAYAHVDVADAVAALLDSVVPSRYRLVPHEHVTLRSQVLIDLPDIDSKYQDHIDLTRRVLRHLLYPIFVQSIEKYADARPQRLLAQVAEGNDPSNFLFCLNKVDHLVAREGEPASLALADDYARRLRSLLELDAPPRVFRVSAAQPARFDLPTLRDTLASERSPDRVRRSMDLAAGRRQWTLVRWLESQRLDERLARADRLLDEARELVEAKLLAPVKTRVVPRLLDEATLRAEIGDAAARRRIARWPIVNVVDVLLWPLTALVRRNPLGLLSSTRQSVRAIVGELVPGLDANIRSIFADLRRRDPSIAELYGPAPPWDDDQSEQAVADLTTRLADAVEARKRLVANRAGRGHGKAGAPLRWLLTLGALLWFPIVQPILEIVLNPNYTWAGMSGHAVWQLIQLLGSTYLLKSVCFLAIYFVALWATLRFTTTRATERLITRLDADAASGPDDAASVGRLAEAWSDELLAPLATRTDGLRELVERIRSARQSIAAA